MNRSEAIRDGITPAATPHKRVISVTQEMLLQ